MPDTILASTGTTATLGVGGSATSRLDTSGDHDWFRASLNAGQTYLITTSAAGDDRPDTTITLRNASGTQVAYNDDASVDTTFSRVRYTPTSSGTYYIDIGGYDEAETGDYVVSLATTGALPIYTNDQIAAVIAGGANQRHFDVAPGGTIAVDMTGLTSAGQGLAREALAVWSDITGLRFSEVAGGAQITFDDNADGASTAKRFSGGYLTSASVNVSTQWLADYGTTIGSYAFQTYLHEIGHALGLSHPGTYNGEDVTYANDALFANDSWAATVMSYFSETENSYTSGLGFTRQYDVTPTAADALALQSLYGTRTPLRTGDTTYGFGNNSGRPEYDSANASYGFTIFDDGGNDTLDYSGFSQNQTIDLTPESYSNIGGKTGNMQIGRGVVIENAIGGSGSDTLIGNAANNVLSGGVGNDVFRTGGGRDTINGGDGFDTLELTGTRASYSVFAIGSQTYLIGAGDGLLASSIESVRFSDVTLTWSQTMSTAIDFDGAGYFLANPDVARANGNDTSKAATHFVQYGFYEGRQISTFDALEYIASNPDLIRAFGLNTTAAQQHYLSTGIAEGRPTASFDAMRYIASSPDLIQALGPDAAAGRRHYIAAGFAEGRSTTRFDPLEYVASHPDLIRAIGTDTARASQHYVSAGYREGRATARFDALEYVASNPDLIRAFGLNLDAARTHYISTGYGEGRVLASFDGLRYIASHADLIRALGPNAEAGERHYITSGLAEGRAATFDGLEYVASNSDLIRSIGADATAGARHYIQYGFGEQRAVASFDATRYLASNIDLIRGFGYDLVAAERHYIQYGFREGRSSTAFDATAYLAANTDLARAYGANVDAGERHYVQYGYREGRVTGGFDATAYMLANRDLLAAGLNPAQAVQHWLTTGAREGRSGDTVYGRDQTNHAVALNGTAQDTFTTFADRDWFSVSLTAGQRVSAGVTGSVANGFAVEVVDDHGVSRGGASGAGTAAVAFTADHDGLYYLSASHGSGAALAAYTVDIHTV